MRRHFLAGAAIDDDRLVRAEKPGGAGGVEGGIAAAIDDDLPAEEGAPSPSIERKGSRHRRSSTRRRPGYRRAGRYRPTARGGVVAAPRASRTRCRRPWLEHELDAHMRYPPDFGVEHVTRQAVFRDPKAHHAAGERPGLTDRHAMAETAQVIGGREARRTSADHEHPACPSPSSACRTSSLRRSRRRQKTSRPNSLIPTASSI